MRRLSASLLFFSGLALANDGFYQGAGAELLPVGNPHVSVISENLVLEPLARSKCFSVEIAKDSLLPSGDFKQGATAKLGRIAPCSSRETLKVQWRARAEYKVVSHENQKAVQMGFPVPGWNFEKDADGGLSSARVPAVAEFRVKIDGREIKQVTTGLVGAPKDMPEYAFIFDQKDLSAFIWKLDFEKDRNYTIVVEYLFGLDLTTYSKAGMHFPEGAKVWFDKRSLAEERFGDGSHYGMQRVLYFLHPIRSWGSTPPKQIKIKITAPAKQGSFYLNSPSLDGLKCIDEKSWYLEWNDAWPTADLAISYPASLKTWDPYEIGRFKSLYEFVAWADAVNTVKAKSDTGYPNSNVFSCKLLDKLERQIEKGDYLQRWRKNGHVKCLPSCE